MGFTDTAHTDFFPPPHWPSPTIFPSPPGAGGEEIKQGDKEVRSFSRDEIAELIVQGNVLVLYRGWVLRVNAWLEKHPGGPLALLHFVGRDATDEIEAYHPATTVLTMKRWAIGRVRDEDWDYDGDFHLRRELKVDDRMGSEVSRNRIVGSKRDEGEAPKPLRRDKIERLWKPLVPPIQLLEGWERLPVSVYKTVRLDLSSLSSPAASDPSAKSTKPTSTPLQHTFPPLSPSSLEPPVIHPDLISPVHQRNLSLSYRTLHQKIITNKLYQPPQFVYGYGPDLVRYSILFSLFLFSHFVLRAWFFSAVFLGLFWHQVTFVVHDAGHSGVTGHWGFDRALGISLASVLGGLSLGWWCDNHDVHHLVTNHPTHDPDIQHMPFFAISPVFLKGLWSTYYQRALILDPASKLFLKVQHNLYYFIMCFGRFNLFANSYIFLAQKAKADTWRNLEWAGIVVYWIWFGALLGTVPSWGLRIMYILVSFAVTSPLHVQIVLSHFGQSTEDLGLYESFVHRQARTTMDVICPPYLDFIHGGLHLQVIHHFFPRIPRQNLRPASEYVIDWCKEEGLEYHALRFLDGNRKVLGVLGEVANQVKILGAVAKAQAKGEIHSH